jgi:YD repeat-containing protein
LDILFIDEIPASSIENAVGGSDNNATCTVQQSNKTPRPIYPATGDKEIVEKDFSLGSGGTALQIERTYHSQSTDNGRMGYGWAWSYGWSLVTDSPTKMSLRRPDGKLMTFQGSGTGAYSRLYERTDETVTQTANGWHYLRHDRSSVDFTTAGNLVSINTEDGRSTTVQYDANGVMQSISDPFGRVISLALDGNGRITGITDALNRVWNYVYDASGNLLSVGYPDRTSRQYVYEDTAFPHNLTGIIDEQNQRYGNYAYDTQGRAILSEYPLSGYRDSVVYNTDGTVTLTDAAGQVKIYTIGRANGLPIVTGVSEPSCNCGGGTNMTFDAKGYMDSSTDKNGVITSYTYDAKGNTLSKTEAAGIPDERTTA